MEKNQANLVKIVDFDEKPDTCCFKTNNFFTRKVFCYNLKKCILYMSCLLIFICMVLLIVAEGLIYMNSDYSKFQQVGIIVIALTFIESVVLIPIVISCCLNKPLWVLIVFNLVYVIVQVLFIFSVLVNVEN